MRWSVFALFTFIALVLETSLLDVLSLGQSTRITPSFVACLAVFVTLFAPRTTALWACFVLGLFYQIASPPIGPILVIGPHALGFVFASFLLIQLRTMVFRRRTITVGVLTIAFYLAVSLIVVTIFVVRSWHPALSVHWSDLPASRELFRRFGVAIYSGLFALPAGWLLIQTLPLWGFQTQGHRGNIWR